ncbi:MAG: SCP2 sterol-binding domain-containing protein [Pseudomonadota bacterium]
MIDLGIMFKPLTLLINKRIAEQTPARDIAESLEGETMAVRVRDTGLAIYMTMINGKLKLSTRYDDEPSVVLSGSPISLAGLAGSDPLQLVRDGHIQLSGDAMIGARFQGLLRYAQPDLEDELSNVVGDTAAHTAGNVARGLKSVAGAISSKLHSNMGEYLTEGRETLPSRELFDHFRDEVEVLRDDVARATARVQAINALLDELD